MILEKNGLIRIVKDEATIENLKDSGYIEIISNAQNLNVENKGFSNMNDMPSTSEEFIDDNTSDICDTSTFKEIVNSLTKSELIKMLDEKGIEIPKGSPGKQDLIDLVLGVTNE